MPRRSDRLSFAEARRIALAAQGFGRPRGQEEAGKRELRRLFERLGVVQIDSVNVLARAHTLPAFSRLGRYRSGDLHALAYGGRRRALFEYWGHEASLLPVALQPLLRWRMARAARGDGIYGAIARFGRERRALIDEVRREIAERGPLAAGELSHQHKGEGGWWGWSDGKRALEWLFWAGEVTTATRRGTFERVYGLTERVLPRSAIEMPTPDEADAQRELLIISARCLGVATERCLRDYFRLGPADARPRIAELVEAGELIPTQVEGWDRAAYLHRDARRPRRLEAQALLAPFDPLIWQRQRVEALFGARIRLELYTPREKRMHGYYVLPFLLGDRIVARVDLKADRAVSTLRVKAAHAEAGVDKRAVVAPLAAELRLMAAWLELDALKVERVGDLARLLSGILKP
ncbi:MAG: winged helix DNA-binding domain-containing protein [Hyphomonadaceae bacterium]|nr:winged helix DNA-binding domain-containing protein [Hyphomonadaceae bacterium]